MYRSKQSFAAISKALQNPPLEPSDCMCDRLSFAGSLVHYPINGVTFPDWVRNYSLGSTERQHNNGYSSTLRCPNHGSGEIITTFSVPQGSSTICGTSNEADDGGSQSDFVWRWPVTLTCAHQKVKPGLLHALPRQLLLVVSSAPFRSRLT